MILSRLLPIAGTALYLIYHTTSFYYRHQMWEIFVVTNISSFIPYCFQSHVCLRLNSFCTHQYFFCGLHKPRLPQCMSRPQTTDRSVGWILFFLCNFLTLPRSTMITKKMTLNVGATDFSWKQLNGLLEISQS